MTPAPLPPRPPGGRWSITTAGTAVAVVLMALCPSASYSQITFEVLKGFDAPYLHGDAPYAGLIQASDGNFYGTTRWGGAFARGTVFRLDATGTVTTLHHFRGGSEGNSPYAGVIEAADGNLYGTTVWGGAFDSGTIFKLDTSGTLTTLHSFARFAITYGGLTQAADGSFYGTNYHDFTGPNRTVFKLDTAGTFTIVHRFGPGEGAYPFAGLTQGPGGSLYGTTQGGGAFGKGTVFKFDPAGTLTTVHSFHGADIDGEDPWADLTLGHDGSLYGTTRTGTVFKIDAAGTCTTLHTLSGDEGQHPLAHVIQGSDGNLYGTTLSGPMGWSTIFKIDAAGTFTTLFRFSPEFGGGLYGGIMQAADGSLYGTTAYGPANGGTLYKFDFVSLTTLHSFIDTSIDGSHPYGGLIQGVDGSMYGTTRHGGVFLNGTIFRIDSAGTHETLHRFDGSIESSRPMGPVIQGTDGSLYGSTEWAALGGTGSVFRLDTAGTLTVLHSFTNAEAYTPHGGVIHSGDGGFVGTAISGGSSNSGTIFKLDGTGALIAAYSFTGGNGAYPDAAPVLASDGNIYGTTVSGGALGRGTVFKLDPAGTLTTLHHFTGGADGATPFAGLIQVADGSLRGTTWEGGASNRGTVFKLRTGGALTTLHSFSGLDGAAPAGGVIQGTDGSLYGTTQYGGTPGVNAGTIFRLDANGTLTTLHRFNPDTDGRTPYGFLAQAADGTLYGTTYEGGPNGGGTVFRLTIPTAPPLTFSLSKTLISGCLTTKGIVSLMAPAPSGGTVVTLTSDNAHASVPGSVKVGAGKLTTSFTIRTTAVAAVEAAIIDARIGGTGMSQTLTLKPMGLKSVTLSPSQVTGGSSVAGTITLECAAGPGAIAVTLSSTKPATASPTSGTVTVPMGMSTKPFTVTTVPVAAEVKPKIKATANGVTKSKTLTVKPAS
jgi:uncharacterized repeat protein (TIGR03803 family)